MNSRRAGTQTCDANCPQRSRRCVVSSAAVFRNQPSRSPCGGFLFDAVLRLFEMARVLVRLNHVAHIVTSRSFIFTQ